MSKQSIHPCTHPAATLHTRDRTARRVHEPGDGERFRLRSVMMALGLFSKIKLHFKYFLKPFLCAVRMTDLIQALNLILPENRVPSPGKARPESTFLPRGMQCKRGENHLAVRVIDVTYHRITRSILSYSRSLNSTMEHDRYPTLSLGLTENATPKTSRPPQRGTAGVLAAVL